jgi:hypothetical protein
MNMQLVTSTTVRAVGYDATARTLRVQFKKGGVYEYLDVDPALFEAMLQPYPWRRVGDSVKAHRYRKIG